MRASATSTSRATATRPTEPRASARVLFGLALLGLGAPAGCYLSHQREGGEPPREGPYVELGAGDDHTCAVRADGALDCWGLAQHGQLGDGSGRPELGCELRVTEGPIRTTPARSLAPASTEVAGGALFSCAVLATVGRGGAACWGAGCRGELGDGTTGTHLEPVLVPGPSGLVAVAAGLEHVVALDARGAVWSWGGNASGQLGLGTTSPLTEPGSTTPVRVEGVPPASLVAAGDAHTCAATASEVWCWGGNGAGQLGDGTTALRSIPAPVAGLPRATIVSLAAGERFTCASLRERGVWCWGWNERHQLGSGHRCDAPVAECMRSEVPLEVPLPAGAWTVACGGAFACAFDASDGGEPGIWCWGADEVGQLGDGAFGGTRARPERVRDAPETPVRLALGDNHGCALDARGTVWCWGRNAQGQLGDGTTVDRPRAAPIAPGPP